MVALAVTSMATCVYFFVVFVDLPERLYAYYWYEYVLSGVLIVAVLEGTRRAFGWMITLVSAGAILYAYFGYLIPPPIGHGGFETIRILEAAVLNVGSGILSSTLAIVATWVAIFIIYAELLTAYGGLEFIRDNAIMLSKRFSSGIAQIAVITSMGMGSIVGSSLANTAATGSFTIPLMKEHNLEGETAAAIESIASSGGQILPPVMGAAAFLMAEFLGVSFASIIAYAFLPALLFYAALVLTVAIITTEEGIDPPRLETDRITPRYLLRNGLYIVASIIVLVYSLVVLKYDPLTCGIYAIGTLVGGIYVSAAAGGLLDDDADVIGQLIRTTKQTIHGFVQGGRRVAPIMIVIGPLLVIIRIVPLTGINQVISIYMVSFGNTLPLLLLLAAVMSVLFGMGMPSVAAYILVTIFVVPGLIQFGVTEIQGHFFVFYYAIISGITPPVAVVIAVASGIADSNFLRTCMKALPVALPLFIIPFVFVYNPQLLVWGGTTPAVFLMVLVGIIYLILMALGYYFGRHYGLAERAVLGAVGLVILFAPALLYQAALATPAAVYLLYHTPNVNRAAARVTGRTSPQ
jgi:TRAP transporter 4TM/12TM fusion protein